MFKSIQGELSSYLNRQRNPEGGGIIKAGPVFRGGCRGYVGYHEVSYFCRVFRRLTGKTPSDIQKEPKKSIIQAKICAIEITEAVM